MGKKRVVIYDRIAGAAQEMMRTDEFLLKRFSGLLEQHPEWEIDNIYRDVQQSYQPASTRPALNQLLLDCRKGLIDAVLARSVSDISRDITEVKDIVDQLNNLPNSVPVFFWRERISSISNDFQLLLSFVEPIAQECNRWIKEDPSIVLDYCPEITEKLQWFGLTDEQIACFFSPDISTEDMRDYSDEDMGMEMN